MAEAHTLHCLACGAATRSDASKCGHCGARLATVACPSCFGMIFQGSRFCPLCGARADRAEVAPSDMLCPHCDETNLQSVTVGRAHLCECAKCQGLWVDKVSFEEICTNTEQQSAVLGAAIVLDPLKKSLKIKYVKCPQCRTLMHRVNFAGCSGVVVDVCKHHGTWFDEKELQHIVTFIRTGGMERAREKQKAELEEATRRAQAAQREATAWQRAPVYHATGPSHAGDVVDVVLACGEVLSGIFSD